MKIRNIQPLALLAGWIVEKNELLEIDSKEAFLLYRNSSSDNLLLILKYEHREQKRKFSFQNYELSILVEYLRDNSCDEKYLISVFVEPCDAEKYLLDKVMCRDSKNTAERIKHLASQYSSPYNWKRHQIEFINKIWENERIVRNVKNMMVYRGTEKNYKPIDFIFLRIPAGWSILLNSFCEKDTFHFPLKQQHNIEDFDWERDISAYRLELNDSFVYVELQEYMNKDSTNSLLHIYVYYDLKDKSVFFEKLESIFCYSVEEAKKELEEMLLKYGHDKFFDVNILSVKGD